MLREDIQSAPVVGRTADLPAPTESPQPSDAARKMFAGDGEMRALMRKKDWGATPLGPVERWPHALRTALSICLDSRFPISIWWGRDLTVLTVLYNDAYRPVLGEDKHPRALGAFGRDVWSEIWSIIGPMLAGVMERAEPTFSEDLLLPMLRNGYLEETYFTFSYSPIRDDDGGVSGVLIACSDTTERVVGERRLRTLRDLANGVLGAQSTAEVCEAASAVLAANPLDIPCAALYLVDDDGNAAHLVASAGFPIDAPERIAIAGNEADHDHQWGLATAARTGRRSEARLFGEPTSRDRSPRPSVGDPPQSLVVLPLRLAGRERTSAVLVLGRSAKRPWDEGYRGFFDLVAGQVTKGIAEALALTEERRRVEALAALDRAKSAFFSNVSHELRTPLTLILSPVEEAVRAQPPVLTGNDLAVVQRNAQRLLKLVNALLDFSRLEGGRIQAKREPVDLPAYTAELASTFRSLVERAQLRLVVDTPPFPADVQPACVDRDMWEKMVFNLLSNAFKHTFEGEIAVRVFVRDGRAVLQVADTGVGIAPDQRARIFDRFHRVPDARSRTHEGTGIGLSLVRELVQLHDGSIEVESEVDLGTTFTISIPLGDSHVAPNRVLADISATNPDAGASNGNARQAWIDEALGWLPTAERYGVDGSAASASELDDALTPFASGAALDPLIPRILIADDNSDMREYLVSLLRARGWVVDAVSNGSTALESVRSNPPDLVLTDVMMPGLDGFGLLHALRHDASTRTVPVVLLSARAGEEARVEGMEAGAADYVVKPFKARELVARVEAHLTASVEHSRRARDEQRETAERNRLLEVAQEERTRLQNLFELAPAAIAVLRGPEHVFESVNAKFASLTGRDNLVGKPVRLAIPAMEGQQIVEMLDSVFKTGTECVRDGFPVMIDRRGTGELEETFFNFVYQPISESDASISGVLVHGVDVTEQVQAQRDAELANRSKSDFLAAMSHELRTPLNAIAGYVELMDMGIRGEVTEEQRTDLARIRRSQQHLLSLINDVLNYAKIEGGRVEYDMKPMSLADVVNGVMPMIEPQLAAKEVAWRVDVDADLKVLADHEKLEQVLLNLLTNAVKFTNSGGSVSVDASSVVTASHESVELRVRDTGIGIPAAQLSSIFDPFVQVKSNLAGSRSGAGLGLAISRDLTVGMGGALAVESAEGEGSVFTLTLRRA